MLESYRTKTILCTGMNYIKLRYKHPPHTFVQYYLAYVAYKENISSPSMFLTGRLCVRVQQGGVI